jgi:hypothetical protein
MTRVTAINAARTPVTISNRTRAPIPAGSMVPFNASVTDQEYVHIVGEGRDVTILKGNYSQPLVWKGTMGAASGSTVGILEDLTIWNQSTASGSGTVWFAAWGNNGEAQLQVHRRYRARLRR